MKTFLLSTLPVLSHFEGSDCIRFKNKTNKSGPLEHLRKEITVLEPADLNVFTNFRQLKRLCVNFSGTLMLGSPRSIIRSVNDGHRAPVDKPSGNPGNPEDFHVGVF